MESLKENTYITVYHRDPFWVPYYLYCILMIFSRSSDLLFSILLADDTKVAIEGVSYNDTIKILNI